MREANPMLARVHAPEAPRLCTSHAYHGGAESRDGACGALFFWASPNTEPNVTKGAFLEIWFGAARSRLLWVDILVSRTDMDEGPRGTESDTGARQSPCSRGIVLRAV